MVFRGGGRRDGRRLSHSVSLHHRHTSGVEELEDLLRDWSSAGNRFTDVAAECGADVHEQLLVELVEGRLELIGHGLAGYLKVTYLHSNLGRLGQHLRVNVPGDHRVELLEDPWHRGQEGRLDLANVGDDLRCVAGPVGDRCAGIGCTERYENREGVGEREEEVDDVVAVAEEPAFGCHVEHRAVVGLREDAALRWAGRSRGVDEGVWVFRLDGFVAGNKLLLVAAAATLANLVK